MTVDEHELLETPEDFGEAEELDETSAEFIDQLVKRIIIFTEEFCDIEFFPYQIPIAYRIIESVILGDGDLMTVMATRQCLDGDTVVLRRDGSACRIRNHEDAWSTGIKATKEYRVHGGGNIIATDNHPFWTPSGWKMAGELQVNDLVAVMDGWIRETELKSVPDTEARFLGYMVTDGSMRPYQSYKFTNINKRMLDEVADISESYGVPAKWYAKGRGFDLLFTTKRRTANPIRNLLDSYTWDHGFPTDVFSWDKKAVGEFVNRAWSGDGCLSPRMSHGKMTPDVFLACGNDNIYAQYWRSLLLMHGIHSTVKQEMMPKGTGIFNRLVLGSSAHNIAKFFDLIGGPVFAKEDKSQEILDIIGSLKDSYFTTTSTEGKYSPCEDGLDGEAFRFAPIISITDAGEREVFDVCYPEKGWFVGNGFKVHNSGKSEVLSAVIAGMMVILPKLAPIYPLWLDKFSKGFWVGTFAPTEEQADTVFGRIVSKLTSDHALEFLLDPEIDDKATGGGTRGRGRIITLKNSGSLCRMQTCNPKAKIESKTYHMVLVDEAQEADEVMVTKSIAPMLAFNNGSMVLTGTANRTKSYFYKMIQYNKRRAANGGRRFRNSHFEYDYKVASKYNPNYAKFITKEKLRIGEDSDEFQMSYSNKFILEKGMFVTEERLDRMYDQSMPLVKEWWRTPIVVGIDVARANDSTVVTAVWVDWDHPDPFGFYEHRILNWLEINNEEWESQYFTIIDFLRHYNVLRVGVDAQGVGGAVAERLGLLLPGIDVLPVSSDSKAQNERWIHLTELIQRDQLIIPGHSKARRNRTWKRFNQQMSDLEKVYKGPYLLAAAPEEKGAFDDYPDSLAIACYMTVQDTMPEIEASNSPFFK